jgi:hypothetical protein
MTDLKTRKDITLNKADRTTTDRVRVSPGSRVANTRNVDLASSEKTPAAQARLRLDGKGNSITSVLHHSKKQTTHIYVPMSQRASCYVSPEEWNSGKGVA